MAAGRNGDMYSTRMYSPSDVMAILSVSRAEAHRIMHEMEQRGQLFRHGRLLRVKAADLDAYIKEQMQANTERAMSKRKKLLRIG